MMIGNPKELVMFLCPSDLFPEDLVILLSSHLFDCFVHVSL